MQSMKARVSNKHLSFTEQEFDSVFLNFSGIYNADIFLFNYFPCEPRILYQDYNLHNLGRNLDAQR